MWKDCLMLVFHTNFLLLASSSTAYCTFCWTTLRCMLAAEIGIRANRDWYPTHVPFRRTLNRDQTCPSFAVTPDKMLQVCSRGASRKHKSWKNLQDCRGDNPGHKSLFYCPASGIIKGTSANLHNYLQVMTIPNDFSSPGSFCICSPFQTTFNILNST